MDKYIKYAEKALTALDKMKEGLNELISLLDISDDIFGEMDRLEIYKSINRTINDWREPYEAILKEHTELFEQTM